MPDKLLDAAVRMERLEGQQNLLAQQVKASLDAMTSALNTVQLETRAVTNKLGDVVSIQHSQDSNKNAIDEVKKSLGDLNVRLEEWFDDFDQRNQRRWEQYESNRDAWRREHEGENANTKRELEREVRSVRETVIRWGGVVFGLGLVVTLVTSVAMYALNQRFDTQAASIIGIRADFNEYRSLTERRYDDRVRKIHEIELYLSRGGERRNDPYITEQQRQSNGPDK